jgi:hypothetical protein
MILLKFLGSSGNDATAPKHALFFGLGSGSIPNYIERAVVAVLKVKETTVTWPDEQERKEIAERIAADFDFVNCIGIIDGTLFPLEFKPSLNGEDYFTRKGGYMLHSLIVCDDVARIRYISLGWPGSVHDNRVWLRSKLNQNASEYFDLRQYLLGDSAFKVSSIMIPAYKKPFGSDLDAYHSFFNTTLAKIRIRSEHCIGMLKGRFQYLKRIRGIISDKKSLRKINRHIMTASILHNLLIQEPYPEDWIVESDGLDDDDELNEPAQAADNQRREQLFAYMVEHHK